MNNKIVKFNEYCKNKCKNEKQCKKKCENLLIDFFGKINEETNPEIIFRILRS